MDGSGERAVVQEVVSFGSRRPNEARNLPRYCCVDICTAIRAKTRWNTPHPLLKCFNSFGADCLRTRVCYIASAVITGLVLFAASVEWSRYFFIELDNFRVCDVSAWRYALCWTLSSCRDRLWIQGRHSSQICALAFVFECPAESWCVTTKALLQSPDGKPIELFSTQSVVDFIRLRSNFKFRGKREHLGTFS